MASNPTDSSASLQEVHCVRADAQDPSNERFTFSAAYTDPKGVEVAAMMEDIRLTADKVTLDRLEACCDLRDSKQREIGEEILRCLSPVNEPQFPLRIIFTEHEQHETVFACPFELIAKNGVQYCLKPHNPLIRVLDQPAKDPGRLLSLPIKILIVIASPKDLPPITANHVEEGMRQALGSYFGKDEKHLLTLFRIVEGMDTFEIIKNAISTARYDIVEIIAHGVYDSKGGAIFFVDENGGARRVDGNLLSSCLERDDHVPSLVIMNSCKSAGGERASSSQFTTVAWHLLRAGIPAVIAMQTEVEISATLKAEQTFYARLFGRQPQSVSKNDQGKAARKTFSPQPLDACVQAMRGSLGTAWYAPVLAIRNGFNLEFLAHTEKEYLERLNRVNGVAENEMGDPEKLIRYLRRAIHCLRRGGTSDKDIYRLIHQRDIMASKILEYIRNELRMP